MKKISHKIGLFSILIALIPMLCIGVAGYMKSLNLLYQDQIEMAEQSVIRAEDRIINKLDETKAIVTALAENVRFMGIEQAFKSLVKTEA